MRRRRRIGGKHYFDIIILCNVVSWISTEIQDITWDLPICEMYHSLHNYQRSLQHVFRERGDQVVVVVVMKRGGALIPDVQSIGLDGDHPWIDSTHGIAQGLLKRASIH